MKWLRNFIENNAKIIEVTFSFISLVIVGVFGTTISINNSITSRASLELSRANAQPVFSIKTEITGSDEDMSEELVVNIDGGFAENVKIVEYTFIHFYVETNGEKVDNVLAVSDYFLISGYTGNNRGEIAREGNSGNYAKFIALLKESILDEEITVSKETLLAINYQDITGNDLVKYYESKTTYCNHIDNAEGKKRVEETEKYKKILVSDLSIARIKEILNEDNKAS